MKAILEFNMPEEDAEFRLALEGCKYSCVIDHIFEVLRQHMKYEGKTNFTGEEIIEIINNARERYGVMNS